MHDEPKQNLSGTDTRRKLLAAAANVIRRQGISRLTLEAAAREAGVSKGGLLYHFPNKEALIGALVQDGFGAFDEAVSQRTAGGMDWLGAYLDASQAPGELDDLGPALLGALAENPGLLAPARQYFRQWYAQARNCGGMGAVLLLLVLDGLFIHQTLGLDPVLSPAELAAGLGSLRASATGGAACSS